MTRPSWAPEGIDLDRPSASRVYDYFVGGMHNFEIDRTLARQIESFTPNVAETMRANRDLLRRCVRHLVDAGITQFLDLGSGIPTVGNVHEVAQARNPQARVVYVDIDPVAVAHSRAILDGNPHATVVQADVAEPDTILNDPLVREVLDFDRPIAVLLLGVLHFVPDEADPAGCGTAAASRRPGQLSRDHPCHRRRAAGRSAGGAEALGTNLDRNRAARQGPYRGILPRLAAAGTRTGASAAVAPRQSGGRGEHPEFSGAYGGLALLN